MAVTIDVVSAKAGDKLHANNLLVHVALSDHLQLNPSFDLVSSTCNQPECGNHVVQSAEAGGFCKLSTDLAFPRAGR